MKSHSVLRFFRLLPSCPPEAYTIAVFSCSWFERLRAFEKWSTLSECICISTLRCRNYSGVSPEKFPSVCCHPQSLKPQSFRNPYDIPRSHLLDQLSRMRRNLLNTSVCTLRGHDSGNLLWKSFSPHLFGCDCATL